MFKEIFLFELRYWLKRPMPYVFFLIVGALVTGATVSDSFVIGGSFGNILKNSPFVIANFTSVLSILCLAMVTSFTNGAALKDYNNKFHEILFTTPIKKFEFISARFLSAAVIALIPISAINFGILIGQLFPQVSADQFGPFMFSAHFSALIGIGFTNILISGTIIFMVALYSRSSITAFIATIVIIFGYLISGTFIRDIESEFLGALLDPFGMRTMGIATKYYTIDQKNNLLPVFESLFLINRAIWLSIALVIFFVLYKQYHLSSNPKSFRLKKRNNKSIELKEEKSFINIDLTKKFSASYNWYKQLISLVQMEVKSITRTSAFIILSLIGIINLIANLMNADNFYGLGSYPVTYNLIELYKGSFTIFTLAIIIFYSGALVWKERENKMNDLYDALPYPTWISFASKLKAIMIVFFMIQIGGIVLCIITQALNGFTDFNFKLYFVELILVEGFKILGFTILALFIQIISNNRYIGYFVFIAYLISISTILAVTQVSSQLVDFGSIPDSTYSDMNGYGPYVTSQVWHGIYWYFGYILLGIICILLWNRGTVNNFKSRWHEAKLRFTGATRVLTIVALIGFVSSGSWIYYNTKVLNEIMSEDESNKLRADYEKNYKKYEKVSQPKITHTNFFIELYPSERKLDVLAEMWIKNKTTRAIDTLFLTLPFDYDTKISLKNSKLTLNDTTHYFQIYKLNEALLPGDSILMNIKSWYYPKGFENQISNTSIVENGTFFNNKDILPVIGYNSSYEISEKNDRKDFDLAPKERMPRLTRNCHEACAVNYLAQDADWVTVNCEFGTSADQIAIAPGKLIKQYEKNGRKYFHYQLNKPSANFYSFISARYEVAREKLGDIDIEVYYHHKHKYNVDKMLSSLKNSLTYYIKNFGPYYHQQARIIEFPRYGTFAQAFPGTMPYSESIGFISKIEEEEDIDMVNYVVAHEMGHQWWAHQLIGAEMQGATLLSESFSQYSAIRVMEQTYGKDQMRKFLKYELDKYLDSRGSESVKELPILQVENQQYIHYNKGSLVTTALAEYLGVEKFNGVLKNMIDSLAYRNPPYANSYAFLDRLKAVTPDSLQNFVKEQLEEITIYDNRCTKAELKKEGENYVLDLEFKSLKFKSDSLGKETEVPANDWVQVGVYDQPKEGNKYGKNLFLGWHKVNKSDSKMKITLKQKPYEVGIDPNYLLPDRIPKDNMKVVELKN